MNQLLFEELLKVFSQVNDSQNLNLTGEQLHQFGVYFEHLLTVNEMMNLTAITNPEQVAELHLIDSLSVLSHIPQKSGMKVIDVGTGAGLPGIPMQIMRKDLEVTLMDATKKRLNFLDECISLLELHDFASTLHARAEDAGQNPEYREKFDCSVARAVASLPVLLEYCMPFVKVGGIFIAMKSKIEDEFEESRNAIKVLGGELKEKVTFQLPISHAERTILVINKIMNTPKQYPRHPGKIKQKHL